MDANFYKFDSEPERQPRPNGHARETAPAQEPVTTIDWPTRESRTPPDREFIVENWLPTRCCTSLYAPGGIGKSMLAQQLGSAVASGRQFLGLSTIQAPVLGVF